MQVPQVPHLQVQHTTARLIAVCNGKHCQFDVCTGLQLSPPAKIGMVAWWWQQKSALSAVCCHCIFGGRSRHGSCTDPLHLVKAVTLLLHSKCGDSVGPIL